MNRRLIGVVFLLGTVFLASPEAFAQGIPRTAQGKPDFSGLWSALIALEGSGRPGPSDPSVYQGGDAPRRLTRREQGLAELPLAQWGREAFLYYTAGDGAFGGETGAAIDPRYHDGSCGGPKSPSDLIGDVQIFQNEHMLMLTYMSKQPWIRKIWLGREHPEDLEEYVPFWMGHSVGNWDGDTLIVDTVRIKEGTPIDTRRAIPQSGNLRMIERISFSEDGGLNFHRTFEDPVAFTKPWSDDRTLTRRTDWEEIRWDWEIEENHDVCDPNGGYWREHDPWFDNYEEFSTDILPDQNRLDGGLPPVPEAYRQR